MKVYSFAIIGNPVEHSLSPTIHFEFAQQFGLRMDYSKLLAPIGGFLPVAKEFLDQGGHGLNVTAPFKHEAFTLAGSHDKSAQLSGAVNTLTKSPAGIKGFNTDGVGLIRDLTRLGWDIRGAEALILGAGGACRGILGPLLAHGAHVTIANRTVSKAKKVSALFPRSRAIALDDLPHAELIINTIPAQSRGLSVVLAKKRFSNARLYDLNYSLNGPTPFLKLNAADSADASDGIGMLIEQAAESFRIWTGCDPDTGTLLQRFRSPHHYVRRYIAGATCPRCGSADRIYVLSDKTNGRQMKRGCAACEDLSSSFRRRIETVRI